jgi:diguanylate cyclase (GGDEF)-like protein/PAS domain S-box-containing protein
MPPGPETSEGVSRREPFRAGWTGALAVGLFAYILFAILMITVFPTGGPVFEVFNLYCDAPACIVAAVLAGVAARRAPTPSVRRIWWYLTAAISVYTLGNLQNSTYWLFGIDPFPSFGDVFFVGWYPLLFAAILSTLRAANVRVQWGRLALDATILMLGFGAFFWFFVIAPTSAAERDPDVIKYVLTQTYIFLNAIMVLVFGVLLMHGSGGPIRRRTLALMTIGFSAMFLADIVWALSKVTNTYFPGGLSDTIYLLCYGWLIAAAREQLRGGPAEQSSPSAVGSVVISAMPYFAMLASFLVLVYLERDAPANPTHSMTVVIFVLTLLVMVRQGVLSRDDALLRERRAVGMVEARYASLIKNASDVIMIADIDGRLRFASPAAERTFSAHPDELVGRNLLDLYVEANRERLAAFLTEVGGAVRGRTLGPIELAVDTDERRTTLECVGSNLLDDPAVAGLALNFRDVSERKTLEEQLRQLAFHDPLTLLANRSLFSNRVEHALALVHRSRQLVAVVFIDLDNFKNVNDTLGHAAGDRLLQAAAQRLVKSTRPSDTVARLGGDEFAILLEGIGTPAEVERIAAAIMQSFNAPLLLDGTETPVAASIGVAFSQPGDDTEQLLRNADIAMYNAKAAGKARYVVYHPSMQEQLRHRLRLEEDMNRALERKEFFLEFQPIIDLTSRELLGVEALVRWNHPKHGLLMPSDFVPIAEESGQVVELGRQVLIDACCQIREWSRSIVAGDSLRVSVNISGRHLQHADLLADVRRALEISGLDPGNLVIELTESTIMHNTELNLERFRALKALGVRLAIDDFGMGYSSLSYLHRFPIDILKIDRAFVSRLSEQDDGPELARAVVMLGETLGLETVAEGIEDERQVTKLLNLGCVAGQGFLFDRATALSNVAASAFASRRAELRRPDALLPGLTATGRFNSGRMRLRPTPSESGRYLTLETQRRARAR